MCWISGVVSSFDLATTPCIYTYQYIQHTATHCNSLRHTTIHTATHCNTLQHYAIHIYISIHTCIFAYIIYIFIICTYISLHKHTRIYIYAHMPICMSDVDLPLKPFQRSNVTTYEPKFDIYINLIHTYIKFDIYIL